MADDVVRGDMLATESDQLGWRLDEHRVEGGWFGGEFPRLWPPRCPCGCAPSRWSPCTLPCCVRTPVVSAEVRRG